MSSPSEILFMAPPSLIARAVLAIPAASAPPMSPTPLTIEFESKARVLCSAIGTISPTHTIPATILLIIHVLQPKFL